ncbi:hypothetical protein JOL79_09380 [Microbispora sp. RL4-1S]|uniref:Uncharacterized protein n=1 Tax=Microbispora oryzae TaxID=2806554 RepID=A0A940WFY3_9ACTN|nr:hypothetical protein [Microbispora oryzae]MBP2704018.1 hypothetical protein [Microbispora oryzae]
MPASAAEWALTPVPGVSAPPPGAVGAVLLVCASTLVGAALARRNFERLTVWLATASATMLITALVDLLPRLWTEAARSSIPLWALGSSGGFGFVVVAYFTRRGCACPGDGEQPGAHAPGLHRRATRSVEAALYGGVGTAAALTLHRALEGAALALTASVVVIVALVVHSASEGMTLGALLAVAGRRPAPWLALSCIGPAAGLLIASLGRLPTAWVPILLAMVMGVLCRTAYVGIRLAAGRQRDGRLSGRQIAIAAVTATAAGALMAGAHTLGGPDGAPRPNPLSPGAAPARTAFPHLAPPCGHAIRRLPLTA